MVEFDYYNKRTSRIEHSSLPNEVFRNVISCSRMCGLSDNVFNVRFVDEKKC